MDEYLFLIIIALVLAIPTYGISLIAYVTYIFIKSYARNKGSNDLANYKSSKSSRSGGILQNKDEYYSKKLLLLEKLLKENDDFMVRSWSLSGSAWKMMQIIL